MQITDKLVNYATNLNFKSLPREVIERCKILFLDFIGIPIKASEEKSSRILFRTISEVGAKGPCTVIPHRDKFQPQYAGLINGAYGHSLDFDDTHREASIHPGAAVIPAILAVGEENEAEGEKIIEAMVAGYDVTCKLGMAINPAEHYSHGFHGTATCGIFGATVAAGIIEGVNYDELSNALGIDISLAAGSMQFLESGSWNKRLHPGFAAHNAILSIKLARNGFLGAKAPIEGTYGLLNSYTHNPDLEKAVIELGERYEIMFTGIKPYPCCRYIHPAVDLVIQAVKDGKISKEEIEKIDVEITRAGYYIVGHPLQRKQNPQNVVDAQFSLPFAVAVAILKGRLTVDEYNDNTLNDIGVKKMMKKVSVRHNEELDKEYPQKWPVVVTIKTNHDKLIMRKDYPKGEPEDPMSFKEVADKFRSLAHNKLSETQVNEVLDMVERLDKLGDIRELTESLIERK
ncbi:hypothetical protein DRP07_08390 [Archaeoglobales archaeon]|nr:MAG: hypothetical protein DRP07_08390 [Archaeoglobales archaeon]